MPAMLGPDAWDKFPKQVGSSLSAWPAAVLRSDIPRCQ